MNWDSQAQPRSIQVPADSSGNGAQESKQDRGPCKNRKEVVPNKRTAA